MRAAEGDPFLAELTVFLKQRVKTGGEGIDAACRHGPDDTVRRDIDNAEFPDGMDGQVRQDLVQHGRVGIPACVRKRLLFLLAQAQSLFIFQMIR